MGKGDRGRAKRQREGADVMERLRRGEGMSRRERQAAVADISARSRAVFSDHPAVGIGARTDQDLATGGRLSSFTGPSRGGGTTEALPVLLLEPTQAIYGLDEVTGYPLELRVDGIVQTGFTRWVGPLVPLVQVDDWVLRRPRPGVIELQDEVRAPCARTTIAPDPEWLSAAASQHVALVVYGPQIGVGVPDGIDPAQHSDAERHAELERNREIGHVAVGIVAWDG